MKKKVQHQLGTTELDSLLKLKKKFSIDNNKQTEKVKDFMQHLSVELFIYLFNYLFVFPGLITTFYPIC